MSYLSVLTTSATEVRTHRCNTARRLIRQRPKKIVKAAEDEANKNRWPVAIAVVEIAEVIVVLFQRLDHTQLGSVEVSIGKAKTAVMYKRSTKVLRFDWLPGGRI